MFHMKLIILLFSLLFSLVSYAEQNKAVSPISSATTATQPNAPIFSINIASGDTPDDFAPAIKVVAVLTLLTFGPAILLLMSAFTRIIIVLSFLRQALGSPTMPPKPNINWSIFIFNLFCHVSHNNKNI